jgi:Cu+-exporting ATPase
MITGDRKETAEFIAQELGITNVVSEVLPHQKMEEIINLQRSGKKVAFVGDGINDSPAIVQADL